MNTHHLADKGLYSQSYGFSGSHVWLWELDNDAFLNCGFGERLLRVPWTAKRSNQSILKEISPGISLDAKAETPVLWPPHVKSWLTGKDSDAGRDWGQEEKGMDRGWDGWIASLTRWTWVWVNSGSWWWTGRSGVLQFMGSQKVGHDWVTELNWEATWVHWGHRFGVR